MLVLTSQLDLDEQIHGSPDRVQQTRETHDRHPGTDLDWGPLDHPEIVFQVVTSIPGDGTGIGLVRLTTPDPLPLITDIQSRDNVQDLELLWKHDAEALLQIQTEDPLPLLPVWRAGVPLKMPFDIQDGAATWEVTTSTSRLSNLRDHLDDLGIGFAVESVREIDASQAD